MGSSHSELEDEYPTAGRGEALNDLKGSCAGSKFCLRGRGSLFDRGPVVGNRSGGGRFVPAVVARDDGKRPSHPSLVCNDDRAAVKSGGHSNPDRVYRLQRSASWMAQCPPGPCRSGRCRCASRLPTEGPLDLPMPGSGDVASTCRSCRRRPVYPPTLFDCRRCRGCCPPVSRPPPLDPPPALPPDEPPVSSPEPGST
jgi:hypothetical protein